MLNLANQHSLTTMMPPQVVNLAPLMAQPIYSFNVQDNRGNNELQNLLQDEG